jgi:hypothetical protein
MNVRDMNVQELTELFRKLGTSDPEGWARSQIRENIPQLARFLFLRQAWKLLISEDDRKWISEARQVDPKGPGGDIGPAITRILAAGGDEKRPNENCSRHAMATSVRAVLSAG